MTVCLTYTSVCWDTPHCTIADCLFTMYHNPDTGEGARRPLKSVQPPFAVELKPMEIRTFLIAVEYM